MLPLRNRRQQEETRHTRRWNMHCTCKRSYFVLTKWKALRIKRIFSAFVSFDQEIGRAKRKWQRQEDNYRPNWMEPWQRSVLERHWLMPRHIYSLSSRMKIVDLNANKLAKRTRMWRFAMLSAASNDVLPKQERFNRAEQYWKSRSTAEQGHFRSFQTTTDFFKNYEKMSEHLESEIQRLATTKWRKKARNCLAKKKIWGRAFERMGEDAEKEGS